MAERAHRAAGESGFTLAEMLAALLILLVGVTALLATLSSSIAQRRTTDARHEAAALCEHALHRLRQEVRPKPGGDSLLDLELPPLVDQPAEGFPGMTWSAKVESDPDRLDLWLVRISVQWLEVGEVMTEEFLRVLPRQLPLAVRVRAFRAEREATTR